MNLRSLIEKRIREAQEQGKFRNLKGEGAALHQEDNPFEDPEMRIAYKVMSNAGFAPAWVELMKEIDAETARAERIWADYRAHRKTQTNNIHRGTVARFAELVAEVDAARDRALARLQKRWEEINKKINYLNATVPVEGLKRSPLRIDRQREKFEWEFPLLGGVISRR